MSLSLDKVMELIQLRDQDGLTWNALTEHFPDYSPNALRKTYYRHLDAAKKPVKPGPKILLIDIESAPMLGYVWGLWDNNVALNQLHTDWYILSWSAKWLGSPEDEVMYMDNRNSKNIQDDSNLLGGIWELMDQADVVCGQNSKKFDVKKLNSRFIQNGFGPPSSYRQIDTLQIAKSKFGFTSNKLEYMTKNLCTKYKKSGHAKFSGFELWNQCLAGNLEAWEEMRSYNILDVLSLEELYLRLQPWDKGINVNVFHDSIDTVCACGSLDFSKKGFIYSNTGKFQRLRCNKCGAEVKEKTNLLSKEKKKSLKT